MSYSRLSDTARQGWHTLSAALSQSYSRKNIPPPIFLPSSPRSLIAAAHTSEFATFTVPPPYSQRVRAALNASAPAVHLSGLVGAGGWWYRFGAAIAKM